MSRARTNVFEKAVSLPLVTSTSLEGKACDEDTLATDKVLQLPFEIWQSFRFQPYLRGRISPDQDASSRPSGRTPRTEPSLCGPQNVCWRAPVAGSQSRIVLPLIEDDSVGCTCSMHGVRDPILSNCLHRRCTCTAISKKNIGYISYMGRSRRRSMLL